jgi:membrane protein CcdC involved in cytochrome C biogenesis
MTLCEQGALGLILFFALIMAALFLAQNLYRRCPDRDSRAFCLALCASLVTILVNIFFSDLIEADKIGTMFWALLAMLVGLDLYVRRVEASSDGIEA